MPTHYRRPPAQDIRPRSTCARESQYLAVDSQGTVTRVPGRREIGQTCLATAAGPAGARLSDRVGDWKLRETLSSHRKRMSIDSNQRAGRNKYPPRQQQGKHPALAGAHGHGRTDDAM